MEKGMKRIVKIEVDLPDFPDWENERCIYIMAGIELAAFKMPGEPWMIKVARCDMCGKCCMELSEKHPLPITVKNGICDQLVKEPGNNDIWKCAFGSQRPFACCIGEPDNDYCSIQWKKAE